MTPRPAQRASLISSGAPAPIPGPRPFGPFWRDTTDHRERRALHYSPRTSKSGLPLQLSRQVAPGRTFCTAPGSKATRQRPPTRLTDG